MTQADLLAFEDLPREREWELPAALPTTGRVRFASGAAGELAYAEAPLFLSTRSRLLHAIDTLVRRGGSHLVVTLNSNQSIDLRTDSTYRGVFGRAAIRTLDGAPIVALARLLGIARPIRNTGADLLRDVCRYAPEFGWRVAIVGGQPEVAEAAVANLRAGFGPIVDAVAMPMLLDSSDPRSESVIDELERLRPQIVFLCLGAPKQELWFDAWRHRLPAGVYVGAGASAEFVAGSRRRAPRWVQRAGGEWCWRLAQEPGRLSHRYLIKGPRFAGIAVESILSSRLSRRARPAAS